MYETRCPLSLLLRRPIAGVCLILFLFFNLASLTRAATPDRVGPKPSVADLSLEQLMQIEVGTVYGASKFEQKTTRAPSSVTIVTAEDIKVYGYRTLADILQTVSGFYVTSDRAYTYIGVRGFSRPGDYNTRVLLLVDGHRINDSIYSTATIGNDFVLDVDLIDKVEIIKGPGSSLYGNNAFFGVINVITKQAKEYNGIEVSGATSSFDTYKGRATYGQSFGKDVDLLFSGSASGSKGQSLYYKEFDNPGTGNGRADSCDHERGGNVFADMRYREFRLQGAYVSREKGIPTAAYGTIFNDNKHKMTDDRGYLDLKYAKDVDAVTGISARAYYDYYRYDGSYPFDYPPVTLNKDEAEGKWWGAQLELTRILLEKHRVVAGTEYQDYFLQRQRNYDQNPFSSILNDDRGSYAWAGYLQDEFSVRDDLILNAGLRYDHYKTFGSNASPRIGLIYAPCPGSTLKLLYGEAFRAPNAYELFYQDNGTSQKANTDLKPEKIETYEIVLEQYLKNYRLSASAYYYRITDLINLQTDPSDGLLVFRNIGEVESKGAEFEAEGKWANGWSARVRYSFQNATDRETGRTLTNSPKHLGKLNLQVPIVPVKLVMGLELQYTSSRTTPKGDATGGFAVANLTFLSREIVKNLEVSGSIYNILNKKYGNPVSNEHQQGAIVQDGTAYRLKFVYRF